VCVCVCVSVSVYACVCVPSDRCSLNGSSFDQGKIPKSACGGLRLLSESTQRRFNSYTEPGAGGRAEAEWRPGDFLVHLAGCDDNADRDCEGEWREMLALIRAQPPGRPDLIRQEGQEKPVVLSGLGGGALAAARSLPCLTACDASRCRVKEGWVTEMAQGGKGRSGEAVEEFEKVIARESDRFGKDGGTGPGEGQGDDARGGEEEEEGEESRDVGAAYDAADSV